PGDQNPSGLLRSAEDEGGDRSVRAGEGQPVEAEHRQVGLPAALDGSDVVSAQSGRRTRGRPVEDPIAGDDVRPVAQALEVEGLSDLADEVRGIVRRRTVDAEADG